MRQDIYPKHCYKCGEELDPINHICTKCNTAAFLPDCISTFQEDAKKAKKNKSISIKIKPKPKTMYKSFGVIAALVVVVIFIKSSITFMFASEQPDNEQVIELTQKPTITPTLKPTVAPTATPTPKPTKAPTPTPLVIPLETIKPTQEPTVEPTEKPIVAEKIKLPTACQIEKDTSVTLPITTTPTGCKYTISSSNSSVVSVHGKKIKGKKEGTAVITVTSGDVSAKCRVTVVSY